MDDIFKLGLGVAITLVAVMGAPYLLSSLSVHAPLSNHAWLVLLVAAAFLIVKATMSYFVAGDFQLHKFGYDNCVVTFGAVLTAFSLQLAASTDLFPGLNATFLLKEMPSFGMSNPALARAMQLLSTLLVTLVLMLLAAAISKSIHDREIRGESILSGLNTFIGTAMLLVYVQMLITKG